MDCTHPMNVCSYTNNKYIYYYKNDNDKRLPLQVILWLEGICIFEVIPIILKDLPGNLVLGVVLHFIRMMAITQRLSGLLLSTISVNNNNTIIIVLLSWSITKIT